MSKIIGTIALLALLVACAVPGNGSIRHVSSTPIRTADQIMGLVDCPEVDPAQARCTTLSGSGWTH